MGGLAPNLLTTGLGIEARIMSGAIEGIVAGVIGEREPLVRADSREADDIAIGSGTTWNLLAQLEQYARRIGIRIADIHRLVGFEIGDIGKPGGWIIDARHASGRFGILAHQAGDRQRRCCGKSAAQELAAANFDKLVTSFHDGSPIAHSVGLGSMLAGLSAATYLRCNKVELTKFR